MEYDETQPEPALEAVDVPPPPPLPDWADDLPPFAQQGVELGQQALTIGQAWLLSPPLGHNSHS